MANKTNNSFLPYKSSYYPTLDSSTDPRQYVYFTSLILEPSVIENAQYISAATLVSESHSIFSADLLKQSYSNLLSLYNRERQAEVAFINESLKLDYDPETISIKQLIDSMNKILNFESTYKTNVEKLLNPQEDKRDQNDRLYSLANYELSDALQTALDKQITPILRNNVHRLEEASLYEEISTILRQVVLDTLQKVYINNSEKAKKNAGYTEFINMLSQMSSNDQLLHDLLSAYGVNPEQLKEKVLKDVGSAITKSKNAIAVSKGKGKGGFAFEALVEAIGRQVVSAAKGEVKSTGALGNMKADQIITFDISIDIDKIGDFIDKQQGQGESSTRMKNINALKEMFESIRETKGNIVFVSDKLYDLSRENFEGFTAESPSVDVAAKILEKAGVNQDVLKHLIFLSVNSGEGRINGKNTDDITTFIASAIGNFVFDDTVITKELEEDAGLRDVNRLHVFNLNNIYVPLSVLLKGLHDSLVAASKDAKGYVNVGISPGNIVYEKQQDELTKRDWTEVYNRALTQTKFHIHFFKNFADFVRQALS